ncbi:MAG: DnaT-like ssDNA-binding protein [Spongiibacteraceae bacterium]
MATITLGATDYESYVSLAEAEEFALTQPSDAWDGADDPTKNACLVQAMRVLDSYAWKGRRSTMSQDEAWPRIGVYDRDGYRVDEVPDQIKQAQSILAMQLVTADTTADPDTAGYSEIKVGPITLKVDRYDRADDLPEFAKSLIGQFLAGGSNGSSVRLVRG